MRAMSNSEITTDPEIIGARWSARGFSCDLWIDPPGQRWEDFVHPVDELVIVLAGEMEFEVAGEIFHPKAGEELFIPARALHSARNIGITVSEWLYGYRQEG